MSASRPKKHKVAFRPPGITLTATSHVTSPASNVSTSNKPRKTVVPGPLREAALRSEARHAAQSSQIRAVDKGKGRAVASSSAAPISVHTSSGSEDEDFEEVPIPSAGPSSPFPGTPTTTGTLPADAVTPGTATTAPSVEEIEGEEDEDGEEDQDVLRLEIGEETPEDQAKRIALAMRKKPMTSKDRTIRLEAHKLHVIALLASIRTRNRWCSNLLLKARLLSLLPHPLQSAFNIPPSRFPDRAQRSRLFFDALQSLVTWWSQSFFDISDTGLGLRTRPWDEVHELVDTLPRLTKADFFSSSFNDKDDEWAASLDRIAERSGGEKVRSANSLMKKVLQQEGSRDVSAQLFVSLARACGLGVRLVSSLQAVPWRAEKVTLKKKVGAGSKSRFLAHRQGNATATDEEEDEEEMEEVPIPVPAEDQEGGPEGVIQKMKSKKATVRAAGRRRHIDPADVYRLRPPRPTPQKLGTLSKPSKKPKLDLSSQPPVFWAEVFSRADQRWVPVDPVLGVIRKKTHYEPLSDSGPVRMLYVVAFEEDGFARDVTLRYTKNFGAKTMKLRVPQRKDEPDWWVEIKSFLGRPHCLNRDELEDAELETSQVSEGMPMHMNGFKDHPIYVLERHLKREEVIMPKREVGRFKGEPVYRRANVVFCKTAETWMRVGRRVRDKQEPLKWVKQRAVTLQKRRQQELAIQEGGEAIQQGLYAEWQTDFYRPPPIKEGYIPQNSFGNIDLYAPTMLPAGAVHLPYKGIAKVAKALGISYAEACTGFEFKKQRAIPVITGIVIAEENESLTLEAYWESSAAAEEKERVRKEEKALKRWAKLINGLRVRARLKAEYGGGDNLQDRSLNPLADPSVRANAALGNKKTAASIIANTDRENVSSWADRVGGRSPSQSSVPEVKVEPKQDTADVPVVQNEEDTSTRNGFSKGNVNPLANGHIAEVEDEAGREVRHPALETRRIVLKTQPTAARTREIPSRTKRRKAETPESDAHTTDTEARPPVGKRNRVKKATALATSTRSLRSRSPKSAEKAREERRMRALLRDAIASDVEEVDDD